MINNAIKYAAESPVIKIFCKCQGNCVLLFLEDHGEGIDACDLRRIFDKGYTGNSHHNGKYKSTGMGLYMVSKIMQKLGHGISVESEKGHYTRFCISITGK